jgi:hypothetical protein
LLKYYCVNKASEQRWRNQPAIPRNNNTNTPVHHNTAKRVLLLRHREEELWRALKWWAGQLEQAPAGIIDSVVE